MSETKHALNKLNTKASPGPLGSTASLDKFLFELAPKLINKVQNILFTNGDKELNRKFLKIIPKPGKKDYTNIDNYRPVSLINNLVKAADSIMLDRMIRVFGNKQIFMPDTNFAYKAKVGTSDSMHNLLDTLDIIKNTSQTNAGILSLDFSKAFDLLDHTYMIDYLKYIGCPKEFTNYFEVNMKSESTTIKGTNLHRLI